MFDFVFPELFASDGGIQAYSRALLHSFTRIYPHATLRVFILNDCKSDIPDITCQNIQFFPCGKSRPLLVRLLFRSVRRVRPELIVSTHVNYAPLLALYRRLFGVPVWCSAHGIEVWDIRSSVRLNSLKHLDLILPVSQFTAERLRIQLGHESPELYILPNSFDSSQFCPAPKSKSLLSRYGIPLDAPVILTLSRLTYADRYKNIDLLIDSMVYLLPKWPSLRLLICGDGDDLPRLRQRVAARNVEGSVLFAGRLPPGEAADHLRIANVFALPSTGEGFGIVFLEALGCGIPTLAGNSDGSSEPLWGGRYGMLVDPRLPLSPHLSTMLARKGPRLWYSQDELSFQVANRFSFDAFCARVELILGQNNLL